MRRAHQARRDLRVRRACQARRDRRVSLVLRDLRVRRDFRGLGVTRDSGAIGDLLGHAGSEKGRAHCGPMPRRLKRPFIHPGRRADHTSDVRDLRF